MDYNVNTKYPAKQYTAVCHWHRWRHSGALHFLLRCFFIPATSLTNLYFNFAVLFAPPQN